MRRCKICGKEFKPHKLTQECCSHKCRGKARERPVTCVQCGREFLRANRGNRLCGRACVSAFYIGKRRPRKGNAYETIGELTILIIRDKRFLIDTSNKERVAKITWALTRTRDYATGTIQGRTRTLLHRYILGAPAKPGLMVDHISGDTFDNREANLRLCTAAGNARNRVSKKGVSRFKGVYWHARAKKWCATITGNYRRVYLGLFGTEEDAAQAYNSAALKYHGEFARLNLIEPRSKAARGRNAAN